MPDSNNLRLQITAIDGASPVLDRLRKRLSVLSQPADRVSKSMQKMGEHGSVIENFAKGRSLDTITSKFQRFSLVSFQAFRNVSRFSGELRGLAELAPLAGTAATLGAVGVAMQKWASGGVGLRNISANLGMSIGQVQRFRRLGAEQGVGSGAIDAALSSLSSDAFGARMGNNAPALNAFRQLGISLYGKNGQIRSAGDLLPELSGKIGGMSGVAQTQIMQALGLSPEILPLLRLGPSGISAGLDRLKAGGLTSAAYGGSGVLYQDLAKLDTAAINLTNTLAVHLQPEFEAFIKLLTNGVNGMNTVLKPTPRSIGMGGGFGLGWVTHQADAMGLGLYNWMFGTHYGEKGASAIPHASGAPSAAASKAMAYFQSQGWSKAQAAGIVANLHAESSFKTNAWNAGHYGLAQWDQKRRDMIYGAMGPRAFATFDSQLAAVQYELTHNEAAAGLALRGAKTAAEAAAIVRNQYERPGVDIANQLMREGYAMRLMGGDQGGKVTVDINHSNVPSGVTTGAQATGNTEIGSLKISRAMPEAQP